MGNVKGILEARLNKLHEWLGRASVVFSVLAAIVLFLMMVFGVIDVVSVQTFGIPVYVAFEAVVTGLVLVVWLAMSRVEWQDEQIAATFFFDRLAPSTRLSLDVLYKLAAFAGSIVLAVLGSQRMIRAFAIDEVLPMGEYVPLAPIRLGFALGSYLLALVCLTRLVVAVQTFLRGLRDSRGASGGS